MHTLDTGLLTGYIAVLNNRSFTVLFYSFVLLMIYLGKVPSFFGRCAGQLKSQNDNLRGTPSHSYSHEQVLVGIVSYRI